MSNDEFLKFMNSIHKNNNLLKVTTSDTRKYPVADSEIPFRETTCTGYKDNSKIKFTNCPNCGAPVTNNICEYCGTVLV
jgi:hypothetical protein